MNSSSSSSSGSSSSIIIRWAVYRTDHLIISLELPLLFIYLFIIYFSYF